MGIDECIEKYIELSSEVLQPKRFKADFLGRGKDTWKAGGKYSSEGLARQFKSVAKQLEGNEDAVLFQQNGSCKV